MPIPNDVLLKMCALREKSGKSYKKIAEEVFSSESNVRRVFTGETQRTNHDFVREIIACIGGDPEELLPAKQQPTPKQTEDVNLYRHLIERQQQEIDRLTASHEKMVAAYKEELAYKRRVINIMAFAITVLVVFILAIFLIDILNPNVGWFRKILGIVTDGGWGSVLPRTFV